MLKSIVIFAIIAISLNSKYMTIDSNDWMLGVIKLDINFTNGSYKSVFGIFIDDNTMLTSSIIVDSSFPKDINVKIKDDKANLIICIAKARLVNSNESLSILKINNYTDDHCNYSNKKLYHQELIKEQKINLYTTKKPKNSNIVNNKSPFLIANYKQTFPYQEGFPFFNQNGELIGIRAKNNIIKIKDIYNFINSVKDIGLN